jgi:hypothetical protein
MEATVAASASEVPATILAAKVDFYNGVTVDATALPHDASSFDSVLSGIFFNCPTIQLLKGLFLNYICHLLIILPFHLFIIH